MDFIDEPMPLQVPPEFTPILAAADSSTGPIDEINLPHQLAATITPERELSEAERMAGGAEVSAWKFQRGNDGSGRTWGIYWSALTSWSKDGNTVHFPDIGFVDHNVIAYWIKRSDDATHPTIQARFADLAWEIGRHKKVGRITQDLARRAIDAYLQAVDRHLYANVTDAWLWLDRAIELADGIKDQVRFLSAREAALKLFRSLSAAGKHSHDSHLVDDN
jgi:hypothetical protein